MNKHENAEIVVIGGGAVGTAVACYLARDGADVALVERGEYAWGSSRRCDGHAVTYDSAPGYFSQFCKIGQDMFPEISRELPCDIDFLPKFLHSLPVLFDLVFQHIQVLRRTPLDTAFKIRETRRFHVFVKSGLQQAVRTDKPRPAVFFQHWPAGFICRRDHRPLFTMAYLHDRFPNGPTQCGVPAAL